ncbi:hypothetical protein GCK72_023578 [Caenorhabditis remanei]|uniref:cyclin-dependent kinase n=1 Tax=Caenorhabditis remanei TaxID=31234 RepID=A0A6A5FXK4_CAERE|nr:hypothetical protein GCK72_023578 [Caenorhabditis remanei]KAF1747119.1 hypothetical protein GCK72_023578 [Caenorhabditis remanei]
MSDRYSRRRHDSDDESKETRFSVKPRDSRRDDRNRDERSNRDVERRDDRNRQEKFSKGYSGRDQRSPVRNDRHNRDRNDHHHKEEKDKKQDNPRRDRDRENRQDKRRDRSRSRSRSPAKHRSPPSRRSPSSHRSRDSKGSIRSMGSTSRKSQTPNELSEISRFADRLLDSNQNSNTILEIEDIEKSPTPLKDEDPIVSFTFDDTCGPARPSRVASEPNSDHDEVDMEYRPATPLTPADLRASVTPLESDHSDDEAEDLLDRYNTTPDSETWNSLPDDEKKLHQDAMERRKKRRHEEAVSKLPVYYPGLRGCQHIAEYSILNTIAEGTYGEVFRGKNTRTDEIVALKRFKMEKEHEGFPITALREINMLLKAGSHMNVVKVREVLVGNTKTEVFMAMEYIEHDVKGLIDTMKRRNQRFKTGEQKSLMNQLLSGMEYLHSLWILHRDLKTSNLLISHSGVLKIADFGMAREFGEASDIENRMKLTQVVVTLWYRSPELLLEPKTYSTPLDMWSVGCIMAEFITMNPLFRGENEPNQVELIFQMLGTPNEITWPDINELKIWQKVEFPKHKAGQLRRIFRGEKLLNETGFNLLNGLLTLDPSQRLTASEALNHPWFEEHPKPVPCEDLPTFPARSELNAPPPVQKRKNKLEALLADEDPERAALLRAFNVKAEQVKPSDFQLRF